MSFSIELLRAIAVDASTGVPVRLGFHVLGKSLGMTKAEMDVQLTSLNKERYISQYAKKGVDGFTLVLNQKAFDAIEDAALD